MVLVKKIDPSWMPSENKDLKVGETINIDNPEKLIEEGKVKITSAEKMLEEMTKKELLKYALEKGIVVDVKLTNKEMIEIIKKGPVAPVEEKSPEGDQKA